MFSKHIMTLRASFQNKMNAFLACWKLSFSHKASEKKVSKQCLLKVGHFYGENPSFLENFFEIELPRALTKIDFNEAFPPINDFLKIFTVSHCNTNQQQ